MNRITVATDNGRVLRTFSARQAKAAVRYASKVTREHQETAWAAWLDSGGVDSPTERNNVIGRCGRVCVVTNPNAESETVDSLVR